MANEFSPLAAIQYINDQGAQGKQQFQQNKLMQLAPQIISGDPQAYAQASAISPEAANSYQQSGDNIALKARGAAKYLQSAIQANNPAQIAAARQAIKPFMDTLKPGTSYPLDMDPQQEMAGIQSFLAQTESLDKAGGNVQSTYINRDGQRVAIMRDGSQQLLGNADARTQLRDQPGLAPSLIDLRTGQASPLSEGGQPSVQGSSIPNTPQGAYIDPSLPPEVQQQIRQSLSAGQEVPGQMAFNGAPGQAPQQGGIIAPRQDPSQIITPYQQAQLGMSAEAQQRANETLQLAQRAADRADRADSRAAQATQAKQDGGGMKIAQIENVNRGINRIDDALKSLSGSVIDTGPIDQYAQRYTPQGQELEAAIGGIQNSMLALTRVPGVGSQSDLEARIANLAYPALDKSPEVNRRTLENLRQFVSDIQAQIGRNTQSSQVQGVQQAPSQPSDFSILWN